MLVGEKHTFHCEVSGNPSPTVTWERLDRALKTRGPNHRVLRGGKLRLTHLLLSNRGYYRCLASNTFGTIRSNYVFLNVQGKCIHVLSSYIICHGVQLSVCTCSIRDAIANSSWNSRNSWIITSRTSYNALLKPTPTLYKGLSTCPDSTPTVTACYCRCTTMWTFNMRCPLSS